MRLWIIGSVLGLWACGASAAPPDGGTDDGGTRSVRDRILAPALEETVVARPAFATLLVRAHPQGELTLDVTRDAAFAHRRRIRLGGRWTREEADGEVFHDVVVHPSGELTVAVEDTRRAQRGYLLLRLDADGGVTDLAPLPAAALPASDLEAGLPDPPWRGRAPALGALSQGWVRLVAIGEDLVVAQQSRVDADGDDLVTSVSALRWTGGAWAPRWTRLVDGRHRVEAPLWNYDDFRFIDVLTRPLLAVDPGDGAVVVGRTWTRSRCDAAGRLFGEFTRQRCFEEAGSDLESRVLPFFFTVFSAEGERRGSRVFVPAGGYYYGVHDLDARGGEVVVVGAVAETDDESGPRLYPSRPGGAPDMVAFDGFIAVLDRESGAPRVDRRLDRGRGDLFTAVRWTEAGVLAAGATDWDRWPGGMSVSRGADPWVALLDPASGEVVERAFERDWPSRHALAYAVEPFADRLVVAGADDAPMTHSGDGGRLDAMTFGGLRLTLR